MGPSPLAWDDGWGEVGRVQGARPPGGSRAEPRLACLGLGVRWAGLLHCVRNDGGRPGTLGSILVVRPPHEDFAFSGGGGGADDAFGFHLFDQAGGFVVADGEFALDVGGADLAVAGDDGDGVVEEGFVVVAGAAEAGHGEGGVVVVGGFGDFLEVVGFALVAEVFDDFLDLAVGDEGAVDAGDAAAAGHVEHVAHAEELFGALLA